MSSTTPKGRGASGDADDTVQLIVRDIDVPFTEGQQSTKYHSIARNDIFFRWQLDAKIAQLCDGARVHSVYVYSGPYEHSIERQDWPSFAICRYQEFYVYLLPPPTTPAELAIAERSTAGIKRVMDAGYAGKTSRDLAPLELAKIQYLYEGTPWDEDGADYEAIARADPTIHKAITLPHKTRQQATFEGFMRAAEKYTQYLKRKEERLERELGRKIKWQRMGKERGEWDAEEAKMFYMGKEM